MDQKRLFLAMAISVAILAGFQLLLPKHATPPLPPAQQTVSAAPSLPAGSPVVPGAQPAAAPPREAPRLPISAPRLQGSINLLGAKLDDLVLRDYHETVAKTSPLVRLLEPQTETQPYYIQFGWTAPAGATVKLPDNTTVWTASGGPLASGHPVTLSWDNGQGQTFQIGLSVDDNYMFSVRQSVRNAGTAPVAVYPWSRISRDYTPQTSGYYILHEGLLGVFDRRLKEMTYKTARADSEKTGGLAFSTQGQGGWAGITDKYWLTALVPDQATANVAAFRHVTENGADHYQTDFAAQDPEVITPGAEAAYQSQVFAGAKEVHLLDRYERTQNIPLFSYAVDFGWFWFLTKPFFYAIDWLNSVLGNFGLAILVFTVFVKALFFPLASRSYRSMSKMKLLGPKVQALRERLKDDPARIQSEMMALYRAEKVNPASGCLPMLIQIPVFFSLYKVIFVTIEMRQAPFFGWIHDLSAVDPTNVFTLFGLIPWNPAALLPFLHLGIWPLIMGGTMVLQQRMNPPPADPAQARMFQFMPIIFTFMLAGFPVGLVIYWSWNNLLTVAQQWFIQRQTRLGEPRMART